jgi:osmoprotectant transport system permease protein
MIGSVWGWLTDPANWSGQDGVWMRTWEHLLYSGAALLLAAAVAIPLGLFIGHTGRGRLLGVGLAGAMRAIPSLGLLFVAIMLFGDVLPGNAALFLPTIAVLAILAVPPILAGTYAGVEQVDAAARDAASGMGMRGWQVLWGVEVPCAVPLIASGLRSAALQVVATATLAATVSLGGLGRYLIDGIQQRDYDQMAGGAVLVAVLALLVDLVFAAVQRLVVSPGLAQGATRTTRRRRAARDPGTVGSTTEQAPT